MRQRIRLALLFAFLMMVLVGCANKNFLVSKRDYQNTIKTLGVLPLLVDPGSEIIHPEREAVIRLLKTNNEGQTGYLVDRLKRHKNYFDVRPVEGDVDDLFTNLIQSRELVARPGTFYRGYQMNTAYAAELCRKNMVDAILVIVLNGVVTPQTFWDRTRLKYLQTEYNLIVESALALSADGQLLWEYSGNPASPFLTLQYPDFDEAHYNKTNQVRLKFVALNGLENALQESSSPLTTPDATPKPYRMMMNRVASELKPGWR